jgi:hypothetical protein
VEYKCSLPHSQLHATCHCHDLFNAPTYHFPKLHLNIIILSMFGYSKWSHPLRLRRQNPVYSSPLPQHVRCPANFIPLNFSTEQYCVVSTRLHRMIACILWFQSAFTFSSCTKFWLFAVVPKYFNSSTLSKELLFISVLLIWHHSHRGTWPCT